jgi:hypothetical protein
VGVRSSFQNIFLLQALSAAVKENKQETEIRAAVMGFGLAGSS